MSPFADDARPRGATFLHHPAATSGPDQTSLTLHNTNPGTHGISHSSTTRRVAVDGRVYCLGHTERVSARDGRNDEVYRLLDLLADVGEVERVADGLT